jgi:hypothetical protein
LVELELRSKWPLKIIAQSFGKIIFLFKLLVVSFLLFCTDAKSPFKAPNIIIFSLFLFFVELLFTGSESKITDI